METTRTAGAAATAARTPLQADAQEQRIVGLLTRSSIPFLALIYVVAYIDRSVVGFASLHMNAAVGIGDAAYGLGAGLFFIGYFPVRGAEQPTAGALRRAPLVRPHPLHLGRDHHGHGAGQRPHQLLRAAFPARRGRGRLYPGILYFLTKWFPVRHRARIIGLLVLAQPVALIITGPIAGWLLSVPGPFGLSSWQTLFVLSGLPATLLCCPRCASCPESPAQAAWLAPADRAWIERELAADQTAYALKSHGNPLRRAWRHPRAAAGAAVPAVPAQHLRPVAVAAHHHQAVRRERCHHRPAVGGALSVRRGGPVPWRRATRTARANATGTSPWCPRWPR